MGLLAKLEVADSQYSLLEKLHNATSGELDVWNEIWEQWSIGTAKAVLDEVSKRLRIIEEIRVKTLNPDTEEVQELQPLFGQALWIFGPQYESIEYTSNRGMTTVIKTLFDGKQTGSRNRPDFAIIPDGSVGFYARPAFDENANECGTEDLVIVELKRPGVYVSTDEINQIWRYVQELIRKGYVTGQTTVHGYVLGSSVDPTEMGETTKSGGRRTIIRALHYSAFVGQAEKRMLNLHKRVLEAPFMQAILAELGEAPEQTDPFAVQGSLLEVPSAQ